MSIEHLWLAVGLHGQAFFSARFLVQWIVSERKKQSVVPVYFWYFSIGGSVMLLLYATYRPDPVFILGQGAGLFVYVGNLYLIHRRRPAGPDGRSQAGELTSPAVATPMLSSTC